MWICKPTGLNQGRGIFLLRGQEDVAALRLRLQQVADSQASRRLHQRQNQALIVQQWVNSLAGTYESLHLLKCGFQRIRNKITVLFPELSLESLMYVFKINNGRSKWSWEVIG